MQSTSLIAGRKSVAGDDLADESVQLKDFA
jgi:hypothetical protein